MQNILHKIINSEYAYLYLSTLKISTLMKNENRWENPIKHYISFELGGEMMAIEASRILEILKMKPITPMPLAPAYFAGVTHLRGKSLPVIDSRYKFAMDPKEPDNESCIIVLNVLVESGTTKLGAIVDRVCAVIEIPDDEIKELPPIGSVINPEYILGTVLIEDQMLMIIDSDKVFQVEEEENSPEADKMQHINK
jgi:purine-binding chemotaxis protein CheW